MVHKQLEEDNEHCCKKRGVQLCSILWVMIPRFQQVHNMENVE